MGLQNSTARLVINLRISSIRSFSLQNDDKIPSTFFQFPESTLKRHSDLPSPVGLLLASIFCLIASAIPRTLLKQVPEEILLIPREYRNTEKSSLLQCPNQLIVSVLISIYCISITPTLYDENFSYIRSFHASRRMNLLSRRVIERK
jgi:hypothetical protein